MNRYVRLARGIASALAPLGAGFVMLAVIALIVSNVTAGRPASPQPTKDFGPVIEEIQRQNPDAYNTRFEDNLLMIQVGGDWSDAGATRFACETVKPILQTRGYGDQLFAVYDRFGAVIATGSGCP